jgi:hypothetical protein
VKEELREGREEVKAKGRRGLGQEMDHDDADSGRWACHDPYTRLMEWKGGPQCGQGLRQLKGPM